MQSYQERSAKIAEDSSIAVMVLLNPDATHMEFWTLKPQVTESDLTTREDFARRNLRAVGVVGCVGLKPMCALKEDLPQCVVEGIGRAFVEYMRVLLGKGFAEQFAVEVARQMPGDFIEFAGRLYALPDTRPN